MFGFGLAALLMSTAVQSFASSTNATALLGTTAITDWVRSIAIDPTETFALIAEDNRIERISLENLQVADTLDTSAYGQLRDIVINTDASFAFASSWSANKVVQINLNTFSITTTYAVGVNPRGIAVTPDSNFVFVANTASDSISKINIGTGVVTSIPVGTVPYDVATDRNDLIYVADAAGQISKVDVATNQVLASRGVGSWLVDLAVNSLTGYAYATEYSGGAVPLLKIDLTDLVVEKRVSALGGGVWVPPNGLVAYTGHAMILTSNMQVLATFDSCAGFSSCSRSSGVGVYGEDENGDGRMITSIFHATGTTGNHKIRAIDLSVNQTIDFPNPGSWGAHKAETLLFATSSSGLPVTFSSNTPTICEVYNAGGLRLRPLQLGTCSITATRASASPGGLSYWLAASPSTKAFDVVASPQSIEFTNPGDQPAGIRSVSLNANATSGLPVAFESMTPSVCSLSGSTATIENVGICSIKASQHGDWGWTAASPVQIAFTFASSPQTITIPPAVATRMLASKKFKIDATATSGLNVSYTSITNEVCLPEDEFITLKASGDCVIKIDQFGGTGWAIAPQITSVTKILPSSQPGEVGVSIKSGLPFTNSKYVSLKLIWPDYATAARISNDGGFDLSSTQTVNLSDSVSWEIDDSVKGVHTKVVYVRFSGAGIDTTKTYSDDIILDTVAPTVDKYSAVFSPSSVSLTLKATDDITGVDDVQVKNGSQIVTVDYATKISIPLSDLSVAVVSKSVNKAATSSIELRVNDVAGNWTPWKRVSAAVGATTAKMPTMTSSTSASAKSIAISAKLTVKAGSTVSIKIWPSSVKKCKVKGSTVRGLSTGTCKLTVSVKPKKGRTVSKTVSIKVLK